MRAAPVHPMFESLESRSLFAASLIQITVPPPLGSTTVTKVHKTHATKPVKSKVVVHKLSTTPKTQTHHTATGGGEVHIGTITGVFQ